MLTAYIYAQNNIGAGHSYVTWLVFFSIRWLNASSRSHDGEVGRMTLRVL